MQFMRMFTLIHTSVYGFKCLSVFQNLFLSFFSVQETVDYGFASHNDLILAAFLVDDDVVAAKIDAFHIAELATLPVDIDEISA